MVGVAAAAALQPDPAAGLDAPRDGDLEAFAVDLDQPARAVERLLEGDIDLGLDARCPGRRGPRPAARAGPRPAPGAEPPRPIPARMSSNEDPPAAVRPRLRPVVAPAPAAAPLKKVRKKSLNSPSSDVRYS